LIALIFSIYKSKVEGTKYSTWAVHSAQFVGSEGLNVLVHDLSSQLWLCVVDLPSQHNPRSLRWAGQNIMSRCCIVMKVLFMADLLPNLNSGAAGTECQTLKVLEALGIYVDKVWSSELTHYIKHGNLHYLFELPYSYRNAMKERLRNSHYDVIHVNQPHGYLAAKELKSIYDKCVFVHRSHGFELRVKRDLAPWRKKYDIDNRSILRKKSSLIMERLLERNSRGITKYADGHIVSSTQCKNYLVNDMKVPANRVAVIPQAASQHFNEGPIGIVNENRLNKILYVGQFVFVKAPMVLAKVFNNIVEERHDVKITWVCSRQHHSQARDLLTSAALNRVTFLDWMSQEDLRNVYDDHGIFLFPSFFEGFGKVFLEAMARGM
jgi:glycosyltransferase involved in cell wall biosynthesis